MGLAEAIERAKGVRPALAVGARGAFEVYADGRLIFSKLRVGRFPDDEEILREIQGPGRG